MMRLLLAQVLVYFAVAKLGDAPIDGKTDVNPEGLTAGELGKFSNQIAWVALTFTKWQGSNLRSHIHVGCMKHLLEHTLHCNNVALTPLLVAAVHPQHMASMPQPLHHGCNQAASAARCWTKPHSCRRCSRSWCGSARSWPSVSSTR